MSTTIKFTISDEHFDELSARATSLNISIQDYIRKVLFNESIPITTIQAVNNALSNYSKGDTFTVPELFGDDWNLPNGVAGQFGKKFLYLVESDYSDKIRFTGNFNKKKHAVYEIL